MITFYLVFVWNEGIRRKEKGIGFDIRQQKNYLRWKIEVS